MRLEFGIFFSIVFLASVLLISQNIPNETSLDAMLDNSVPYVGIDFPNELGFDGEGIVIGIIDTGVDHMHPDLYGFGPGGKIIQELQARTGTVINIEEVGDKGVVSIASNDKTSLDEAKAAIDDIAFEPKVGDVYDAKVASVQTYGVFVDFKSKSVAGICGD